MKPAAIVHGKKPEVCTGMLRHQWTAALLCIFMLGVAGCDAKIDRFPDNSLYAVVAARREASDEALDLSDIRNVVQRQFGTPDEPVVPESFASLLNIDSLRRAAGPQYSDQDNVHFGLYREHCATCHGVDGSGKGPAAALLTPYPRDFRPGVFKFKSTGRGDKPTHDDLVTLLRRGIPGTAMPSFATVNEDDLEALVQYTIYLTSRGELERNLIDRLMAEEMSSEQLEKSAVAAIDEIASSWKVAATRMVPVAENPYKKSATPGAKPGVTASAAAQETWWADQQLIAKGKELFHGPLANCASCHGENGSGNATTLDFDDWTKEYTTKLGISPSDRDAVRAMKAAGALTPRQSLPRKLQWGVFHGNDTDEALYRRLVVGVAGSPMPGLLLKDKPDGVGVESADVWAIIAYLRSLSATNLVASK